MLSVSIYTLGCKLNQLESEALASAFIHSGFSLLPDDYIPVQPPPSRLAERTAAGEAPIPDLVIINTCTVTSRSDQKARRIIRLFLRNCPFSPVIVTGCYAKLDGEKIADLEREEAVEPDGTESSSFESCASSLEHSAGRRLFVIAEKSSLLDLPAFLRESFIQDNAAAAAPAGTGAPAGASALADSVAAWLARKGTEGEAASAAADAASGGFCCFPEKFFFHTRGFLKIQDGCDNHCTYCRIRLARGPSVSMPAARILEELRALELRGYWEAVLTGVNISQYYDETLPGSKGLGGLLRFLIAGTGSIGLRLTSLEPDTIDEDFAGVLAQPRIRPHFHLSVQSGSAAVLKRMGRKYTGSTVEQAVSLFRQVKNKPFLACDIIAGFPGETAADFEDTCALCQKIEFAWIHAFPYSKRPGTPACSFPQTVTERDAASRVERLFAMARQGRENYVKSWLGAELEAVIEKGGGSRLEFCRGLSENYLKLLIQGPCAAAPAPGTVVRCTVSELVCQSLKNEYPNADAVATLQ